MSTPVIPVLERLRQESFHGFQASLNLVFETLSQKTIKKTQKLEGQYTGLKYGKMCHANVNAP